MKHPRHMIDNFATWTECNRFLASLNCLVVAAQKCPGVPPDHVSFAALRVRQMCSHYLVDPVACTPASGWE